MPSEARRVGLPPARASLPSSFRTVGKRQKRPFENFLFDNFPAKRKALGLWFTEKIPLNWPVAFLPVDIRWLWLWYFLSSADSNRPSPENGMRVATLVWPSFHYRLLNKFVHLQPHAKKDKRRVCLIMFSLNQALIQGFFQWFIYIPRGRDEYQPPPVPTVFILPVPNIYAKITGTTQTGASHHWYKHTHTLVAQRICCPCDAHFDFGWLIVRPGMGFIWRPAYRSRILQWPSSSAPGFFFSFYSRFFFISFRFMNEIFQ